ncbi:MAG: epoxyqueuosine reductase QueH [Candidatus Hydrothermarchaeales archaeon]
MARKPRLLLHICCAPCSTHVIQTLKKDYEVTGYFYNPNIHPKEEYRHRLEEMRGFADKIGLETMDGEYEIKRWFKAVRGHEKDPEGGERCDICYYLRLKKTAKFAKENGFEYFTTTLSISPHKEAKVINSMGDEISKRCGIKFYSADFKKRDGFKKSVELSKEYDLYRQDYCGCIFSKKERDEKKLTKRFTC